MGIMTVRALLGGALIGLAASIALVLHGRIAGISGTLGRVLVRDPGTGYRCAFLGGMLAVALIAGLVAPGAFGACVRGTPMLGVAGLLVGVGTTLANGCTSGHGVCGISRRSPRSLLAVITFMITGAITVALVGAHA